MKIPQCCGKEMKIRTEFVKHIEVQCDTCGDVVYVKKKGFQKPQLIDD